MAFDLTSGSVLFNFQSPASGSVTDFSIIANIKRSSFASEADATAFYALWTSTDVTRCRFCKADQLTELAFDIIDYDLTTGSEYIIVRLLYSGTISSTGSYSFYFMPALSSNTAYSATDTYGQYNAYSDNVVAYYPKGGGTDRTANQLNMTLNGGVTEGGVAGVIGTATSYNGSDQWGVVSQSSVTAKPLSFTGLVRPDNVTHLGTMVGVYNSGSSSPRVNIQVDNGSVIAEDRVTDPFGYTFTNLGTYSAEEWVFAMATFSSGSLRYGIQDGGSLVTNTTELTGSIGDANVFSVGRQGDSSPDDYLAGRTQHITIYNTSLTDQDGRYEYSQTSDNATFLGTGTYNAPSSGTTYVDGALDLLQGNSLALNGQLIKLGSFNVEQSSTLEINGDMYSYVDAALDIGQYSALDINGSTAEFLDGSLSINQGSSVVLNGQRVLTGSLSIGQGSSLEVKPVVLLQSSLSIVQGSTVILAGSTDVTSVQKPVKLDAFYFKWCGRRCL